MSKPIGFFKKDGKTRPITKKKKGSGYNGQTGDPHWKASSINDLKRNKALERWNPKEVKPPLKVGTKWKKTGVNKHDIFNYEVVDPETVLMTKGSYRAYEDISHFLNADQKKQLHSYRLYKDSLTWYNVLIKATKLKEEGQNPQYQEERITTAKKRIKENRKHG